MPEGAAGALLSKSHGITTTLSDLLWYAMPAAASVAAAAGASDSNAIKAGGTQTRAKAPDAQEAAKLAALADVGIQGDLRLTLGLQVRGSGRDPMPGAA